MIGFILLMFIITFLSLVFLGICCLEEEELPHNLFYWYYQKLNIFGKIFTTLVLIPTIFALILIYIIWVISKIIIFIINLSYKDGYKL